MPYDIDETELEENTDSATTTTGNESTTKASAKKAMAAAKKAKAAAKKSPFEKRLDDLREYKEKHGHANVKEKEDKSLYKFCAGMRRARNNPGKSNTIINDDRIASLDALGFDWTVSAVRVQTAKKHQLGPTEADALSAAANANAPYTTSMGGATSPENHLAYESSTTTAATTTELPELPSSCLLMSHLLLLGEGSGHRQSLMVV